ncbi:MAG: glycosyltransferase family 1 protein [Candidatus Moraniibacteriota bacterium]
MRVAIQASDLDHHRIDGTRVYLKELLKRFGTLSSETEFTLYHRGVFNPLLAPPTLENYTAQTLSFPWAWMQTRFALELFLKRPEKLFLPIQAAPFFLPKPIEVTATIHDLAFRRFPETFPRRDLWKLNFMLETAVKRADKLIAVSESTKRDLLEFFPDLPESRVKVIHHGFDGEFFGTRLSDTVLSETLKTFHLQLGTYILYVGALQPRKNLIRLIQAFEQVKKNVPEMKLVLAGEEAWLSQEIIETWEMSPVRDDIVLPGRVSFETLRVLYQGARMFAFPSLYEGFGLPLLEAFASGVPVLTADNSSLTEVAGDAALYCQAENVGDIAEKLERLWRDETLRADLVQKGNERLKQFSWDKCASETLLYILS